MDEQHQLLQRLIQALLNTGRAEYSLGDYDSAIASHSEMLNHAREIGDSGMEGLALAWLGCSFWQKRELKRAIELFEERLAIAQNLDDLAVQRETLGWLVDINKELGQKEQAISCLKKQLAVIRQIGEENIEQNLLYAIGSLYDDLQKYVDAITFFIPALDLAEKLKLQAETANAHYMLGQAYRNLNQATDAITHYRLAVKFYTQPNDRQWAVSAFSHLADLYRSLEDYENAVTHQKQRLTIVREMEDRFAEQSVFYNLGCLYDDLKQYNEAQEYFLQALKMAEELERRNSEANACYMLGQVFQNLDQLDSAILYYQRSLEVYLQLEEKRWAAKALGYLGALYRSKEDYQQAIESQKLRLILSREIEDRYNEQKALYDLGCLRNDTCQYSYSIECFQLAIELAEELGYQTNKANAHYMLGFAYRKLQQIDTAIVHYQYAHQLYKHKNNEYWAGKSYEILAVLKAPEDPILILEAWAEVKSISKDYITQIRSLLDFNDTGNADINQELINPYTAKLIREFSSLLTDRGYKKLADLLNQLSTAFDVFTNNSLTERFRLIGKILEAIGNSSDTQEIINLISHRLRKVLEENIDKIDDYFVELFREWIRNQLISLGSNEKRSLAGSIFIFSTFLREFPLGNRAINLELAIISCELALSVYTRERYIYPEVWAGIQNDLGLAYSDRLRGSRAENLEIALVSLESALQIYQYNRFPEQWSLVQVNLGKVYSERIRGDRSKNIEKSIFYKTNALQVLNPKNYLDYWAMNLCNLANAYSDRIEGKKTENLEKAIGNFEEILTFLSHETFPIIWAKVQRDLGQVLVKRIAGNKSENIERAIFHFQQALRIASYQSHPEDWAGTQLGLGNAYGDRIFGNPSDNLDQAITHYTNALEIFTRDAFSSNWAKLQSNLGLSHERRISGDRSENLEKAIIYFQNALEVHTLEEFPEQWASIQLNLASVYRERIKGDIVQFREQAIICLLNALQVYTYEKFPEEWASVQHNLGNIYIKRIQGNKDTNLNKAFTCFENALKVFNFDDFPEQWAMVQASLGSLYSAYVANSFDIFRRDVRSEIIYSDYIKEQVELAITQKVSLGSDWVEKRKTAIYHFENALKVYNYENFPQEWANVCSSLASCLMQTGADETENFNDAVSYFEESLKVHLCEVNPSAWAMVQNNLGALYFATYENDKMHMAINYFRNALKIHTYKAFPKENINISYNLGLAYKTVGNFHEAYNTLVNAVDVIESFRIQVTSGNFAKEKLAKEWNKIYQLIIEVCFQLGLSDRSFWNKALEYVERSKARNLTELMFSNNLLPKGKVNPETIEKLKEIRHKISIEQIQITEALTYYPNTQQEIVTRTLNQSNLGQLQEQINQLIEEKIQPYDPSFRYSQKPIAISVEEIRQLLDERTVLIEWFIAEEQFFTFVVTHEQVALLAFSSSEEEKFNLKQWATKYFSDYQELKEQWKHDLENSLRDLSKILCIDQIVLSIKNSYPKCDRLVLIPHRYLHLFPLHALPLADGSLLLDCFSRGISYAPSSQLLQLTYLKKDLNFQRLFAIQNPTNDLLYTNLEVEVVSSLFTTVDTLKSDEANKAAIKSNSNVSLANCHHFACHGEFNLQFPLNSCLILANKEQLTLGEIFSLDLRQSRLATLSACETGMIDPTSSSDEYIGLPSGFLYAGTPNVVSSLWKVNDLSTTFLMIRFYETLNPCSGLENGSVPIALNQAQQWLRNLTSEDAEKFLEKYKTQVDKVFMWLSRSQRLIFTESLNQIKQRQRYPFASPYYWAAFTVVGL